MPLEATDALIWIGQSYAGILCKQNDCYQIPYTKKGTRCYVHEAAKRGCCRKIPFFPKWATPRVTRVFLAHRDAQEQASRGVIFGYYDLAWIEGISPARTFRSLCTKASRQLKGDPHTGDLLVRVLRADLGEPIKDAQVTATSESTPEWRVCFEKNGYLFRNLPQGLFDLQADAPGYEPETVHGISVQEKSKQAIDIYLAPQQASNGDQLTRECWDGSTIVTHIYRNGEWIGTGAECPAARRRPCQKGHELRQKCWNGREIVVARCVNGKWVRTREKCPKLPKMPPRPDNFPVDLPSPSINITVFEEHRDCSLRIKPRGIYLMDALAMEISKLFCAHPDLPAIQRQFAAAASDDEREHAICAGRRLFNKLVDETSAGWRPRTRVRPDLAGKMELRGDLVFFKNPQVFERIPRAAFRGVIKVNGDRLLDDIARGLAKIDLNLYR